MEPREGPGLLTERAAAAHTHSRLPIAKIASTILESKGISLYEVAEKLHVSRTTAIRWLSLMEGEGLLTRDYLMSGKRGRPEVVYTPTSRLRDVVSSHSSNSLFVIPFSNLRAICKYNNAGVCTTENSQHPCEAALCPYA